MVTSDAVSIAGHWLTSGGPQGPKGRLWSPRMHAIASSDCQAVNLRQTERSSAAPSPCTMTTSSRHRCLARSARTSPFKRTQGGVLCPPPSMLAAHREIVSRSETQRQCASSEPSGSSRKGAGQYSLGPRACRGIGFMTWCPRRRQASDKGVQRSRVAHCSAPRPECSRQRDTVRNPVWVRQCYACVCTDTRIRLSWASSCTWAARRCNCHACHVHCQRLCR